MRETSKKLEYAINGLVSEVEHIKEVVDEKFGDLKVKIEILSKKVDVLLKNKKKRIHKNTHATEEAEDEEGDVEDEQGEEDDEEEEVVGDLEDENEGEEEDSGHAESKKEVEVELEEDEETIRQRNCRKWSRVVDGGEALEEKETKLLISSPLGGTQMEEYSQTNLEKATSEMQAVIIGGQFFYIRA
ncbi:unnamed protein product [Cuscuta campestris]|uniref:Uncharacterized protein n=1 Tax=Cuscuta campestris TaxID=132261 RepID=A0A484K0U6_9ASTE|nr:unnamed protein product [Cuscuta campestris]